jgi:hypothetical protein
MDIEQNKQSREALKGYFVPNAIPTAQQFALLIDSMLNQRSDGLVKPAAGPLSIQAAGPPTGLRPVLDFYEALSDAQPSFSLALRPTANTTRGALTVLGEANAALLSIDRASGNIGVGTTAEPRARLEVNGNALITGNLGLGTNAPRAKLEVTGGAIMPSEGNAITAGIAFPPGSSGDQAYIRWYARSGEQTTLEIGNSNDNEDHISLMPSGNVGIGTREPRAKLEIIGNIRVGDLVMGPTTAHQGYVFLGSATQDQTNGGNYGVLFGTTSEVGTTFLNGSSAVAFRIRNADQMRLTSDGNFGIGTITPRAKLEVTGGGRFGDLQIGPWPANQQNEYAMVGSALMNHSAEGNYGLLVGTIGDVGSTYLNGRNKVSLRINNQEKILVTEASVSVTGALQIENIVSKNIFAGKGFRVGVGQSDVQDWVDEPSATGNMGISVVVDTGHAGFTTTPFYFTSLSGSSRHWEIIGTTSVYEATKDSFKVFLRWRPETRLTAAEAKAMNLKINWFAVGLDLEFRPLPPRPPRPPRPPIP